MFEHHHSIRSRARHSPQGGGAAVLRTDSPWCVPLSALRRGDALPPVPDEGQKERLRQLAVEFAGRGSIEQAEKVLLRFFEYFTLCTRFEGIHPRYFGFGPGGVVQVLDEQPMLDFWTVEEPGTLRYLAREWIKSCISGRRHVQELSFSQYLVLQSISEEELLHAHSLCSDYVSPEGIRYSVLDPNDALTSRDLCWGWEYAGALPGTDCPVFFKGSLYLYRPFGLDGCFKLYTYII